MEEMNKTLSVLEWELPDLFAGAAHLYHNHPAVKRRRNGNKYKLPVKPETLAALRPNFTREIEFYHFVRQRLDRQYEDIMMEYSIDS